MSMQVQGTNYYYPYANQNYSTNGVGYNSNPYGFQGWSRQNVQQQQLQQQQAAPKSEKKMGFFEGLWNVVEGAGKAVFNTVKDIATDPKKLITTIAIGTICSIFPPVGITLAVVGGAMGAVQVGKGIYDVATAETYEQQEAACENIGAGALQVGLAYLGAKAGVRAMGNTAGSAMKAGNVNSLKTLFTKEGLAAFGKDAITGGRGNMLNGVEGAGNILKTAGKAWTTAGEGQGYAITRGITNVAKNWKSTAGESTSKRIWGTLGETASQAKKAYSDHQTIRKANKEAKKLEKASKVAEKATEKVDDICDEILKKGEATDKMGQDLRKALEAENKAVDKRIKLEDGNVGAAKTQQTKAKLALEQATKDGLPKETLEGLQKTFDDATKNVQKAEALNATRDAARTKLVEHQEALGKAQDKVTDITKKLEAKGLTDAQRTSLESQLKTAKLGVIQTRAGAPITTYRGEYAQLARNGGYDSAFGTLTPGLANNLSTPNAAQATYSAPTQEQTYAPRRYYSPNVEGYRQQYGY